VAEITHDFADDGFHEIHLSGKQLVFLFMATTVVAVVIFLCGVQVGRSVPTQRAQEQFTDPTPTASAAPTAAAPVAAAGPPAVEPPVPPAEADELSYKKRLEGAATPKESLKPATEPSPARTPPPAARPQPAAPPSAAAVAPQQTAATTPPQAGTWVLQVHALRDAKVANSIVQRLSRKGYPAYVAASGAPTSMYRVLVGRYKDRAEAERVAERLKKEEQFNPWITR
jgi:cell division septation protein DedD